MEIWKDVVGYEGLYMVNNFGDVYSVPRMARTSKNNQRYTGGTFLTQRPDINGYLTVCLADGRGDRRPKRVHRLVAEAFIPNPNYYPCVNHKDETRTNNRVENLEWCSVEYNNNYGTHQQRSAMTRRNDPRVSFPVICVETGETYPSTREAARLTGIDQSQLWHCLRDPWRVARGTHWRRLEV